jgi:hypothetical protein
VKWIAACVALAVVTPLTFAQAGRGTLTGIVTVAGGPVIATVQAKELPTGGYLLESVCNENNKFQDYVGRN